MRPFEGRYADLVSENGLRDTDRHRAMQIVALALENLVFFDGEEDVEIAVRAAVRARLALAGNPQTAAVADSGRHCHSKFLVYLPVAFAPAVAADLLDDLAGASAARTRPADRKKALRINLLAAPMACRTSDTAASGFHAFTMAPGAGLELGNL